MNKEKSVKQRLIAAVLVLVMCVTSFLGTTFAWFTDSVTSAGNTIESGSLKVDLSHKVEDDWVSLKENTDHLVFDYDKWEPGYTRVEQLKVDNLGSLSLQYRLSIEVAAGTADKTPDGKTLADVIDVYLFKGESTANSYAEITKQNSGWVSAGTLSEVMANPTKFISGKILPTGKVSEDETVSVANEIYSIALHMQESAGNEYQNLSVGNIFVNLIATQWTYENDSFGNDYDDKVEFPEIDIDDLSVAVEIEGGKVKQDTTVSKNGVKVTIPAGVKVNADENGTVNLVLSVDEKEKSDANVVLSDDEILRPLDVHVEGVADDNTVPMVITIEKAMPNGLNIGNYTLYHVENGATNVMTSVDAAGVDAHNEFYYDPATGDTTLAMATFSEVALVAETENAWKGNFDYSWYDATKTDLTIANADQLAAFGAIVGGMNGQTQDSFAGKTVKLIADINLGDKESENNSNLIFYPIGYWNSEETYEKNTANATEALSSGFYNFCGTFDGNGHTIENFYQNTWEMKGDHNWYDPIKEQYYRDGMGLFGKVYGGTVKNLTVKNFSSDGEIATTGVIAAYADGATFENIAIFNCNPRVYNIGNGGIVGCVGWYAKEAGLTTTFKNITVDNSNKISALWGSYDVPCGGIVGQYYPTSGQSSANYPVNAGIEFTNCHVSAQMDVYNDVCANYQYYAYRYTGMLIGSVRENETINGHVYPKMDGITAKDCTVHFGTWNDYYYCEIIDNTTASYTHDYQMSRLTEIKAIDGTTITYLDGKTGTVPASGRANYVIVDYSKGHGTENATCYHFKDGKVWNHSDAGTEIVDGKEVLVEDKQHIYLEFNNLVTGYGWGVTTKGVDDLDGVDILDKTMDGSSVEKFAGKLNALTTNRVYTLDEIFTYIENCGVKVVDGAVNVTITNLDENGNVIATFTRGEKWNEGTISFENTGNIAITIQDYYFCKETTITVNVTGREEEEKFETKFTGDFLYRVGNQNAVKLDSLFKAKDGAKIGNISVKIETITGASGTYTPNATWTNGTIQFSGTGVVKVTIKDDDKYCTPTELYLEVVDAVNATTATDATANNVVLLNDIGSGFTVSGRYAVYGNGFTLNYTGNGQYLNNGLKQGVVTVSENGTLDNLRIKATIYPSAYLYYGKTTLGEYVQGGPSSTEGDKIRYHYQLSAVAASGNATISNCYIYGGRTNIFVNTGDVTIKDTVLECGVAANVQIQSNSSHTITLENVTTIQHQVNPTIGDTSKVMLGAGIVVGPETNDNPKIVLKGDFKQYNWVTVDDANTVSSDTTKMIINGALESTDYNHTVNGKTASNLGIIYMNEFAVWVIPESNSPYKLGNVTLKATVSGLEATVKGQVYSLQNATAEQIYSDYANADRTTVNGLYKPQFKYDDDLGGQYVAEGGDEHCYREGDIIHVLFPSGDTKELDLVALVNIVKYSGQNLGLVITVKDSSGNDVTVTDGKITLSDAGEYTVTYAVTDTLFYDKDGNTVDKSIKYSWDITVSVSLKDTAIPDARFEFDATKQKMGYYKPTIGDVKQYLPFLAGLKIYDYNGKTEYLRFDGSSDFNKIASITITGYESNKALVEIKLTDGGVINTRFLSRANSGGGSTYTGKIKTSNNTIYFVTDSGTSNKDTTTTAAYWYVDYYKFTGNNGVAIQSAQQTFNSTGSSASTPSGNFGTTIKYTVTYDVNGGNCGQTTGYATSVATAVTLPTPTRSGYIFAGWYTAASGGTRVGGAGESYTPSANTTLYAQWGKPCTVTYNANGGSCDTTSEKYTGTALELPTPTREGYWFVGWYDAAEGGDKIGDAGATYNPSGDVTLYAHWQEAIKYTVTYNANGGSCGTASATYEGTALTLPTPTRTGYTFNGWYTAATGGTKIGDAGKTYTPSANVTLYAQWTIISYTITVSTSNATITGVTNGQTAHYGDTFSVTVSFSQSNNKTFTVKDASGNTILSKSAAGTYTFTMPASNVTIEASSSGSSNPCVTPDTLVTLADGTQKRIDQVTYADQILVWNFYTGKYDVASASILMNHGASTVNVTTLYFSDGTSINTINGHGFFDVATNEFVLIDEFNAADYIGHSFVRQDGDGYATVELVSYSVEEQYTEVWSILTSEHYNCMLEGMWTVTAAEVENSPEWLMPYEIGEDMKYDEAKMQADIEKYGLYTYEDFADYCTYEQFVAFGFENFKVSVAKGYITWAEIEYLLSIHIK